MNKDEKIVYDIIVNCNHRVTQLEISRLAPELGSHPRHENYDNKESTLRKIRQIVRNLIMKHGLFIGADDKGYYILKDKEQKQEYMKRFERQAKASAASYMKRYHIMSKNLGVTSDYFEQQGKLFE